MKGKHIKLPAESFTPAFITAADVILEPAKSLADIIAEAYAKAWKEDIKANTVIIDEHFAKVNAFDFVLGRDVIHLPPMICGLEVQVSDELPDGYDFAVLEVPETERERLIRKAKSEVAREIFEEIRKEYELDGMTYLDEILCGHLKKFIDELEKKYTEGEK